MTDYLVSEAQDSVPPVNDATDGNDGYVSFELDPLLEDREKNLSARLSREALHRTGQASGQAGT